MTVLDHLWQSSLVAILAYGLTLLFRNNSAWVRYWLWFAASVKFLLPFSALAALGRMTFVHTVPAGSMAVLTKIQPVAMPFSAVAPPAEHLPCLGMLVAVWLLGLVVILSVWLVRWRRLSAAARSARALAFDLPIPVRSTSLPLEPGLVGIWRPVILLPEGIVSRLSHTEIDAILNHELFHLRRRDNLLAMVHMLVEAVFWFHPLVWFIGARLIEEREQACDEGVLACGRNPLEYAQAILKVCHIYLRSPLACASGVAGADLDRRITAIMVRKHIQDIDSGRKYLLAALLTVTVMAPFVTGGLKPEPVAQLAQKLARVLMLPTPANVLMNQVVVRPSQTVTRHRASDRSIESIALINTSVPQERAVMPTSIDAGVPVIIIAVPQLDAEASASDPETKVCRPPQELPGMRLMGPRVCLPQHEWDRMKQRDLVLMPDGRTLVAKFEREHSLKARPCSALGAIGASRASSLIVSCF